MFSAATDLVVRPLLPWAALAPLLLLALAVVALAFWRGHRGAWLRALSLAALAAALLDPAVVREEREGLADVVAVVIDESASQSIEDRAARAAEAAAEIEARIDALSAERGGRAPIERRTIRVSGDGVEGTRLVSALAEGLADTPPDRIAGAILITDGAVSDAARRLPAFSDAVAAALAARGGDGATPPAHLLLTGRPDEFDRRLVLESAPGFGLVNETVTLRFRVEETGRAPGPAVGGRVRLSIDGEVRQLLRARVGRSYTVEIPLEHGGATVVELGLDPIAGELTDRNNAAAFTINGVRDRLRVLLVSGEPHAGERTWRNLLKSDPAVDLVHFTILRPPSKRANAARDELALIPFPTYELFEQKLDEFDLIVFDRYRRWGILETRYISNIVRFVQEGGAVLVSSGPAFAGIESMALTPLAEILPAAPRSVIEAAFRPTLTDLGDRHPVTRALPGRGDPGGPPAWGRWFRQIDVAAARGDVVMTGAGDRPLLILDRVGDGRVALLASDHAWLWTRGYDGGGPQAELLRRLAHWLMKEPELEEEALTAEPIEGGYAVERRSLSDGEKRVTATDPGGATREIPLQPAGPGLWRAEVATGTLGLHRIADAAGSAVEGPALETVAVVGPPAPKEFADPIATPEPLGPLIRRTGGATVWLIEDGTPALRRVGARREAAGSGWIGLMRRDAYAVRGASLSPLAPGWLMFAAAALFALAAWRVEGR